MPESAPFFLAAEGDGVYERDGPPLELVFILRRERSCAVQVFRRAVDLEWYAWEGVLQPLLDERYGKVRYVDADPLPTELLGRMNGGAASAERIKHDIALIRAGA